MFLKPLIQPAGLAKVALRSIESELCMGSTRRGIKQMYSVKLCESLSVSSPASLHLFLSSMQL